MTCGVLRLERDIVSTTVDTTLYMLHVYMWYDAELSLVCL